MVAVAAAACGEHLAVTYGEPIDPDSAAIEAEALYDRWSKAPENVGDLPLETT